MKFDAAHFEKTTKILTTPFGCATLGVVFLLIGTAGAVYFEIYGYKYTNLNPEIVVGSSVTVGLVVLGAMPVMAAGGLRCKYVEQQVQGPPISSWLPFGAVQYSGGIQTVRTVSLQIEQRKAEQKKKKKKNPDHFEQWVPPKP